MKTISLTQPWASLVSIGAKRIETRSWRTEYRGPLAIHAAKGFPDSARKLAYNNEPFASTLIAAGVHLRGPLKAEFLPLGKILAVAELVGVYPVIGRVVRHNLLMGESFLVPPDEPELSFGDYTPGRYAWLLAKVRRLKEPIPAKGALGLWEWDAPPNLDELLE